jgi:tetratricopeptide (TPR) repeat protein
MSSHHFLSYSPADALEFALRLHDALEAGPPPIPMWLDRRDLKPGQDWDAQIVEAIRVCDSLLFVLSRDSVEDQSVCKAEWTRALKYKKPIVPILFHRDAEAPFRLGTRQHVDFTGEFDSALAGLRNHLRWLASPEGVLRVLQDRLADARRDLRRAFDESQRARIQDDIGLLETQVADQQRLVADPQGAAQRVERSIAAGLERERQPAAPMGRAIHGKFINPPPGVAPAYFQGRHDETRRIGDFLKDEAIRLLTVVGRAGIGKTALVCRALKALEAGQLPDDGGPLDVDGIVYLSALGSRRVTVPNLFADLGKLLPEPTARELDVLYRDPKVGTADKMQALLAAFPRGRTVLLLDNFEDLVDPETLALRDAEMDEALRALLTRPHHAVKVILTTRILPRGLALGQPGRQAQVWLDEGLPSPFAENLLRAMDADGKVGFRTASDALMDLARERTRGYPRALEALFAILAADRDTTLREVLEHTDRLLPENVVEVLAGEAFSRLDAAAQQAMQALAIYGRPVPPAAVDYLLHPYRSDVNSAPVLGRLVNMQFARKAAGRYYLHPVDRSYALGRVVGGMPTDRNGRRKAKFTRFALLHRAADYFKQTRMPLQDRKTLDDIGPQLAEFDLRCAGQDYDTAVAVLHEIDADYLLLWGHARLVAECQEQLQGKLSSPSLQRESLGHLGLAYYHMGFIRKAIAFMERALDGAREAKNRSGEGTWLSNLGRCYRALGQMDRAVECHEQAMTIARQIGDRRNEGNHLGNLGRCYRTLGQTTRAIECHEQAMTIARQIGDRRGESIWLGNLGNSYSALGQTARAIACYEQALGIARRIGNRRGEGVQLDNLAEALIDEGRFDEAMPRAMETILIGEEIGEPNHGSWGHNYLALARLYAGDYPGAREAAEAALRYDVPLNNYRILALLGLITLRQDDRAAAHEAFTSAVAQADVMLGHEPRNYAALDVKGLALSGQAVCEDVHRVSEAIAAYRAARAINRDAGIVGRVLRLLDALAPADAAGILAGVREAAAGESGQGSSDSPGASLT